ncbi:MAG: methyltransferase domain-containing protein [Actinobacteria bacterium]|nr:methyltransferase domain-containing protein [Actinomycetota bacterium]
MNFARSLTELAIRAQARSRSEKWVLYERAFPPRVGERVLDVGVSRYDDVPGENYFLRRYPYPSQLTGVGIEEQSELEKRYPEVTFVHADARALPFPDRSFDVVHSNAVIEHVGQATEHARFVSELVRVGRSGFITTPNRWFPIETHTKLPFVHWLPLPIFLRIARLVDEADLRLWLLSEQGLRRFFSPTTRVELQSTKILGWPLTVVALYWVDGGDRNR